MKLTSKGRYAVMAMADLAKSNVNSPTSLSEISLRQGISLSFLEQLFLRLKKNNLVRSARGPKGGYVLSKNPEEIKLSNIISAVDEPVKVTRCETRGLISCMSKSSRCLTHDLWDQLGRQIMIYLSSVTLADVCNGGILAYEKIDKITTTEIAAE